MDRMPAERKSVSDVARERAATRDLIPGLAALLVTQGTLIAVDPDATSSAWHLAWALSPLIAIGLLVWGEVRILRRSAELGNPVQQTQITFAVGIVAWVTALEVNRRRAS